MCSTGAFLSPRQLGLALASLAFLLPAAVWAEDGKGSSGDAASADVADDSGDRAADKSKAGEKGTDANAKAKKGDEDIVIDRAEQANSPVEKASKTYYFVGARYRAIILPKFMMNLFGEGGRTVVAHVVGPEFGIRKDRFEYNLSASFASYAMPDTPFKGKQDPVSSWELVESKIKVLYLTADFLWSQEFTPAVAFNYGFGAGLGFIFGDLYRNQAFLDANNNYQRCPGPTGGWCLNDNNHYNNYSEPSWANGGSKPNLFPWLALQTGLRIKPHRNFVGRFDVGFGTSGFFLGLGADYGI